MKSVRPETSNDPPVLTNVAEVNATVVTVEKHDEGKAEGKTYSAQTSAPANEEANLDLAGFFAIGVTINVLMVTAFFVWAVKQWKQN